MWNRNEPRNPESSIDHSTPSPAPSAPSASASRGRQSAVIGPSIAIRGDLTGEEDLVIEGKVEGEVRLEKHRVEVGKGGRVKADIHAKTIHVLGQVDGNLSGDEEVIIRATGRVVGNIAAPRVTLEDGCNFRGSVDMSPRKSESPARSGARQDDRRSARPSERKRDERKSGGSPAAAKAGASV